ncbi:hypothetical protein KIN20_032167 [Parelaphostrongylus tenuis]|uniref:Uncharacterized protein n=1 Tax=Parelaphostrongylus tenuis TaxID=148309 RepID=A0AAD5R6L8_PARTN|nr:hypothetical protein KIN20_032167 [Parelaphostrongylus tenuis]
MITVRLQYDASAREDCATSSDAGQWQNARGQTRTHPRERVRAGNSREVRRTWNLRSAQKRFRWKVREESYDLWLATPAHWMDTFPRERVLKWSIEIDKKSGILTQPYSSGCLYT